MLMRRTQMWAKSPFSVLLLLVPAVLLLAGVPSAHAQSRPQIETGFDSMYQLRFDQARADFSAWESAHPDDPIGSTAMAASYLFEELNQKGVLTSAFFLDDKKFLGGAPGSPDPARQAAFLAAVGRSRQIAGQRLKANSHDVDGWFALTLVDGMQSDFDSILAKHPLESLHFLKASEEDAATLLAAQPTAKDAYVALGFANYVIGCLPSYKRAFLWFGGIHGDKQRGMDLMNQAATGGHYLQPFAKAMLALAALREHQPDLARTLFGDLAHQFPANPVFANEFAIASQPCRSASAPNGRQC
jgi:hypothetical protein